MAPTSQELPPPSVDNELLTIADRRGMQQGRHAQLIYLVDYVMTHGSSKAPVLDFSVELFRVLGYNSGSRLAQRRVGIDYFICGAKRRTTADVCIFDAVQNEFLLLVQEDKMAVRRDPFGPQVQLVVKAVAAFHMNNASREAAGCPPLAEMVMPGIVMAGTSPRNLLSCSH
ncbi:hypothetical protein BC826DRAFT_966821 [Russula brevipes]|nr:hypothetical protein BC826DRAFT_966821 [Russula brevipes]